MATIKDHRAFLDHLDFLTMHDHFKDIAHTEYDLAVRRLAETQGFAAFGKENNGLSNTYYGVQRTCTQNLVMGIHLAISGLMNI